MTVGKRPHMCTSTCNFSTYRCAKAKKKKKKTCAECKIHHKVFEGPTSRDEFCKWLFSGVNTDCIAMAHNGKGYDTQFILT